ncbi:MAG TPA: PilT/PilU family type 4a pilus ATPase [Candidatus Wallbacteria bacterium]|nr:PilT/PilU family type 4a pilus ATPase [Candidatus Wallbacteria bacterium]
MKNDRKKIYVDTVDRLGIEIAGLEKSGDAKSMTRLFELLCHEIWQVRKLSSLAFVRINIAHQNAMDFLNGALLKIKFKSEDAVYWSIQAASGIKTGAAGYLMSWASHDDFPKNYMPHLIKSLARVNDTASVSFLIEALADENWIARKEAAAALITFGKNIIPQLQSAFANDKIEIRTWIAKIIGQILGRDAYAFFKNMLQAERKEMRYYAISALSEIRDPQALSAIVAKIADPSWLIRVQVSDVLEKVGEEALPHLRKILQEGSSDEKYQSIKIIQKIMKEKAFGIIRDSLNLDDNESKILSLSALSETQERSAVSLLCDSLTDHNYLIQRHAANLMIQLGERILPDIGDAFKKSRNEVIRYWLLDVLNTVGTDRSFELQCELFGEAAKREKIQIMQSVTAGNDASLNRRKTFLLMSALLDKSYSVRNSAFNQIVKFGQLKVKFRDASVTLNDILLKVQEHGLEDPENEIISELVNSNAVSLAPAQDGSGSGRGNASEYSGQSAHDGDARQKRGQDPVYAVPADLALIEYPVHIDEVLRRAVELKASDIHISVGYSPSFRMSGEMEFQQYYQTLQPGHTRALAYQILRPSIRDIFEHSKELDISYEISGLARFRVNMYMDMFGIGMVFRVIPYEIPDLEALGVPPILKTLAEKDKGLVLVTGPTGSGKSTTLAAMINYINQKRKSHIITIEDPVEFVHKPILSKITQREVNISTHSFASALRSSLREDPDIILVGEMRDLETIELAITAAETGHLVFGTVHTSSAANTIDRLIDAFPADKHAQVRISLVEGLVAIVAQTLVKKKNGAGRVAAFEIMTMTNAIGNLIKEGKTSQIKDYMLAGKQYGMQILDDSLAELMTREEITFDEAVSASYNKDDFKKRYGGNQQAVPGTGGKSGFKDLSNGMQPGGNEALYGLKPKGGIQPKPPVKK